MKLRLDYSEEPSEVATSLLLRHEKARNPRTARFILDTGSPVSVISQMTALNMQLKESVLSYNQNMQGVGGETFQAAKLYDVKFNLKGEEYNFEGKQDFLVNPNSRENILGMDFIEQHNLKLVINNNNQEEAYLVRKE